MSATIVLKSKKNNFIDVPAYFNIGDFEFKIGDKEIKIDWEKQSVESFNLCGKIYIMVHLTSLDVERCKENWKESGLSASDIDAELISKTCKITKLKYGCYSKDRELYLAELILESFRIDDYLVSSKGGTYYDISQDVIDEFNQSNTIRQLINQHCYFSLKDFLRTAHNVKLAIYNKHTYIGDENMEFDFSNSKYLSYGVSNFNMTTDNSYMIVYIDNIMDVN